MLFFVCVTGDLEVPNNGHSHGGHVYIVGALSNSGKGIRRRRKRSLSRKQAEPMISSSVSKYNHMWRSGHETIFSMDRSLVGDIF